MAAWWFGYARYTPAPGVIGLERAAAVDRIEASGLSAELGDRAYSETVPAGQVMSTDPSAGENVLDGGTVVVVLSLGKERYDVPKLRGLTEDRAQDRLLDTNLAFGESIGRYSETVPEGTVLRSDPASWADVRKVVMEYHPVEGHSLEELTGFFASVGITPTRHDPGLRAGLGLMWLARTPPA